jgi:magnesium transporter
VQWRDARWLLWREVGISALTGSAMALVVGAITIAWLGTWTIAPIIGAAMVVNLFVAAVVGVMVPLTLRRLNIDPALSSGVILTMFTDCIGFATLLGLGTLFLV